MIKRNKKTKTFKLEDEYKSILNYKEDVNDFEKVYKDIKKDIKYSNIYIFVVFILHIITFTCTAVKLDVRFPITLLSGFVILDMVSAIFNRLKERKREFYNEIEQFPYIKSIIEKCKKTLNVEEDIILMFSFETNIGVFKIGKKTVLNIGIFDLIKINEKELEAILLHEMAHISNEDTLISYKILKSTYLIKNLNNIFISFGLNFLYFANIGHRVGGKMEKFLHFIKLEREKKADAVLLKYGEKQDFINAISKTFIYNFQDQYRFNYNIFKLEEPMDNYLDYYLEESTKNYYEKKEMYDHFLANSLQRLFDTHPSLKSRMTSLGVEDFNINFDIERKPEYLEEVNKVKERFNAEWKFNAKAFWKQNREHNYEFYIRELEKINQLDYEKLTVENKIKLAYCNIAINNLDYALEVYNDILKKHPNNISALMNRAFIYYGRNDKSCIEDFEKVKKIDYTTTENINFYIGTFYNNNGDEEAIKKYRENHLKEMSNVMDRQRYFASKGINAYEENSMSDEKITLIKEKIKDFTCVKGVYYVKLNTGMSLYSNLILFDLDADKKDEERSYFMDEMSVFVPTLSDEIIYLDEITFSKFFKNVVKKRKIKNLIG